MTARPDLRRHQRESCVFTAFEDLEQLGRVTLRDEGKTIAIGKVLKVE